jgi:hypothetical protein
MIKAKLWILFDAVGVLMPGLEEKSHYIFTSKAVLTSSFLCGIIKVTQVLNYCCSEKGRS